MPQKGRTQKFRVTYAYPGQKPGRIAYGSFDEAEIEAAQIGRRGGTAKFLLITRHPAAAVTKPVELTLAEFGPGITHVPATHWEGYRCGCGAYRSSFSRLRDHLDYAGVCAFCWGLPVHATEDGREVECPACEGRRGEEVSYFGIDPDAFLTAARYIVPGQEDE